MLKKKYTLLILIYLLFFPSLVLAQLADTPWPKFHRDIRNTGKTTNFGTQVGKLKWKFVTGAPITASPAIDSNGVVYFGSHDNNIYAVNKTTGALVWKYTTGGAIEFSSPAIDINDILYCGSNDGYLYAFDLKTIDFLNPLPKWKYKTNGAVTASPTIHTDGTIIVPSNDGYVYALNSSGILKWKSPQKYRAIWASPAIDIDSSALYVGTMQPIDKPLIFYEPAPPSVQCNYLDTMSTLIIRPNFFALNLSDGVEKWFFPTFCTPGGMFASPVVKPDGAVLAPFLKTWSDICTDEESKYPLWDIRENKATKTAAYPTDNSCIEVSLSFPLGNGLDIGDADLFSTPAVLEDNSYFLAAGPTLYRALPDSGAYFEIATVGQRIESSPAVDGRLNVYFGSNGGYFYCVCAGCPETPILWQYPEKGQLPLRTSDNNTIASIISSPAIDNDGQHSIYVGAGDGCLYAFFDAAKIAGKVSTENNNTGLQGVKLILTNNSTAETPRVAYTDSNGEYTFSGVENGNYTVIPEKDGYVFTPQERAAIIKQDKDALNINFTAFDGFTLTGAVVNESGAGLVDVLLTIEGTNTKYSTTVTADANGLYSFSGLGYDVYTVSPFLDGYGFNPPSQKQIISPDTVSGTNKIFALDNFIGTKGYQISGSILNVKSIEGETAGIANVSVNLSGKTTDGQNISIFELTDSEGKYSFTGLSNGSYKITPALEGYTFEPLSQNVTIAYGSMLNMDFYAGTGFSISGSIQFDTVDNSTLLNCTVNLYKDTDILQSIPVSTVQPDKNGNFILIGIANGSYIVKPKLDGYGFIPLFYNVKVSQGPVAGLLFNAKKGLYLSGRVTTFLGIGIGSLTIQAIQNTGVGTTSTLLTTVTSADGVYTFTGLNAGDYTISISEIDKKYYQLYPESIKATLVLESRENLNFIGNSSCTSTMFNFPFVGSEGTLVNVFGTNFGWSKPSDNETVEIAIDSSSSQSSSLTMPSGVYFGTDDPATWVKAKVEYWSPVKILAKAPEPAMRGFVMTRVWVVRLTSVDSGCGTALPSNFFFYLY